MRTAAALALLLLLFSPAFVWAQTPVPVGDELLVNSYTTEEQEDPAVASGPDGNFVVAWRSAAAQDGSGSSIVARSFDASGEKRGVEFVMNSYTTGFQGSPALARAADGGFIATWEGPAAVGDIKEVLTQRFELPPLFAGDFEGNDVCEWSTAVGSSDMCASLF